ncbi:hypothetical protein ACLADE_004996 [Escherichia coli]
MDGQTIRQSSVSNRYGTTKVFESQNLTDKQIHNYAQQLAGDTPLNDAPRDKRTYFREINYIAAAFQYQKKNYKSA